MIVDASALLAFLADEPGADRVDAALEAGARTTAVDLADVVAHLAQRGIPVAQIRRALDGLALDVAPFDEELAYLAGRLRADMRAQQLPDGGVSALALGLRSGRTVLTADRAWTQLADVDGLSVEAIR